MERTLFIAKEHLEEAILQYLDKEAYWISISLAGIAEELLGKSQVKNSQTVLLDMIRKDFSEAPFIDFEGRTIDVNVATDKELSDAINHYKNKTKHDPERLNHDLRAYKKQALLMIARALKNYTAWSLPITPTIQRGREHLNEMVKSDIAE